MPTMINSAPRSRAARAITGAGLPLSALTLKCA
jgi:hypothetical protein